MKRTRPVSGPIRTLAAGTPILIIAVFGGLVHAQVPAGGATPVTAAQPVQAAATASPGVEVTADAPDDVKLLVGRSDAARRRLADRARVADERRHRRRAGDLAEPGAGARQGPGRHLHVRVEPRRRGAPVRGVGAARPGAPDRAGEDPVPDRENRGARQRQERRAVGLRGDQGRGRPRRQRRAGSRREEGRRRLAAAGSPGAGHQAGAAAGALRRGQPFGADRVRHELLHQPDRHQQHDRPRDDAAVRGAGLHRPGVDQGRQRFRVGRSPRPRASSTSATS